MEIESTDTCRIILVQQKRQPICFGKLDTNQTRAVLQCHHSFTT